MHISIWDLGLWIEDRRQDAGRSAKVTSVKGLATMLDGTLEKAIQRLELANAEPLA